METKNATQETGTDQALSVIVYPAKDLEKAKAFFRALLGVEPYADTPYYVGFRTGDLEIGLDPRGHNAGGVAYWEVPDIRSRIEHLVAAGGSLEQDAHDVGRGMLIATVKDAGGNVIGLRQRP